MATFNIYVSDGLSEDGLALLRTAGNVTSNPKVTPEELAALLPDYDALIVRSRTKVKGALLEAGTKLKVVGRAGVGIDNIDVAGAVKMGITVVNSPMAASITVAEHALGLMLAMARAIPQADASIKAGRWEKSAFMGSELYGKQLGIMGLGRIGEQVAHLAAAFGMKVNAYDPFLNSEQIIQRGAAPMSFADILASSDYLSLHLPLTSTTRGLIGTTEIQSMKKGARVVSISRGGIIDEVALCEALENGHLAGAALDVFANEPPHPCTITQHPKVICTPHVGAQTHEAQARAGLAIAEEVITVLNGKEPRWKVLRNE
ncbi:MAG: hydroxyacid dehydrogenase [Chloroflexi bacterium]|nr:MAG: hydroxyacid dehydrogenase [Chloroflexota bacterium]